MLENTKFDTPIDKFIVDKDPETGSFQSYVLTAGSLWSVNGDKEKNCLGRVQGNGKLIPSDNAQAGAKVNVKWLAGARRLSISGKRIDIWYYEKKK